MERDNNSKAISGGGGAISGGGGVYDSSNTMASGDNEVYLYFEKTSNIIFILFIC